MADEKERSSEGNSAPEGDVGRTYTASEPELVGKMFIQQDPEVISETNADGSKKLGWVVSEVVGCEIHRYTHGRVWEEFTLQTDVNSAAPKPIRRQEFLGQ